MKRLSKDEGQNTFTTSAGWLFADLLLALAMLFLATNTFGGSGTGAAQVVKLTPTVPRTPGAAATPVDTSRVLERGYCEMNFSNVVPDQQQFIADKQYAIDQLRPRIEQAQKGFLQKRRVGLAIAFGGARNGTEDDGVSVAKQVYAVLQSFGMDSRSAFHNASYFDPLFTHSYDTTTVVIDVYLVELPGQNGLTCPGNTPPNA